MGREIRKVTVVASVSRHNDDQDERDDRLLDQLRARIAELAHQPEYERLQPYLEWT